jgi:hypothetical protein
MRQSATARQTQEDIVLSESERRIIAHLRRIKQRRPQDSAAPPMFVVRVVNGGLMQLFDVKPCGRLVNSPETQVVSHLQQIKSRRPAPAIPPMVVVRIVEDGLMQLYDVQPCGRVAD